MTRREFTKLALAVFAATLTFPSAEALARAGGGTSSSHSSGGGYSSTRSNSSSSWNSDRYRHRTSSTRGSRSPAEIPWGTILFLCGGVFLVGLPLVLFSKKTTPPGSTPRRASVDRAADKDRLLRMAREDDGWSPEHMARRITETYHAVQQAWTERNQELAKDYMSPRLYARHKKMTDQMLAEGRRNVLEDVRLLNIDIVHVADRKGTHDDEFWAVITGAMIDYEVKDAAPDERVARLQGMFNQLKSPPRQFQELWKFTRDDRGWVLDKIEQDLAAGIAQARIFSHEAS